MKISVSPSSFGLKMSKPRSLFSHIIFILTILSSNLLHIQGIDPIIKLPQSGLDQSAPESKRVLHVGDFGAKGDGINDDTQAFKDAWEVACSWSSTLEIVVPAEKTYLVRPIDFAGPCPSELTLRISGTIVAPRDPHVWDGLNPHKWLYFHGLKGMTIEGGGTINGMGHEWWGQSCKTNDSNPCRPAPTALTFHRCKNLKVRNLHVINSQQMHMAFTNCRHVEVSHLIVMAPIYSPNTDGIHISASTRFEVKDTLIKTGDDCISVVSNSSRIRIRNIACGPGHGISIGSLGKSNSCSEVHDVKVDRAFLSNTKNGVRIKTWQGGSGYASKISFRNVLMENVSNPIIIDQYYCDSSLPCPNQTMAVKVKDVSFVTIKGTSATEQAVKFMCSSDFPCENLYLEDIELVSNTTNVTSSFCWQAHGTSSGLVDPAPCFSPIETFINQKVDSTSVQSI